jgi:Asp-tRNA(Asn)/Glu-tRNA(Gln) amidotransferase A subunit family amidase
MTDLWRLTATEAVAKLRKWELSPLELVEAAASRIEAVEQKSMPCRSDSSTKRATMQSALNIRVAIDLAGSLACQWPSRTTTMSLGS